MGRNCLRLPTAKALVACIALATPWDSRAAGPLADPPADPVAQPLADLLADMAANASLALGVSTTVATSNSVVSGVTAKANPVWAFQYKRIRLSTGGGAALLGIVQDPRGPGASAELFSNDRIRMGVALRIDRGRNSDSIDGLENAPDVPATLRMRGYASYALNPSWTLATSLSQDVLGRGGGTVVTGDVGYRTPWGPGSEWYAGTGTTWTDARYMNSYYGVPPEVAASSGLTAYNPDAGLTNVRAGLGFTSALTSHWILFGGVSVTRLVGHAADSPLTKEPLATSASIGLAYRWGAKYEGLDSVLLPSARSPVSPSRPAGSPATDDASAPADPAR